MISGVEVALFSITKTQIEEAESLDLKNINLIIKLLDKPKKLLATILVANNFINIAIVLLFDFIIDELCSSTIFSPQILFFIKVILVTFFILLFGEILPKIYATRKSIEFSIFMARPLIILDKFLTPLSLPMHFLTTKMLNVFGQQSSNLSVDQLSQALELTQENETTKDEQRLLEGIVTFGNTDTKQVMCPRMDVFALEKKQDFQTILKDININGFSRIPIYEDNIDTIIGVLYVKDLIPYLKHKSFDWLSLLRKPFFVPENKKLDDLMVEFQTKKVHLAIVVDEYGGTSGVISFEDIIEEIVGDISDEYDDEAIIYKRLGPNNYRFEGKTNLKDFYKILNIKDEAPFENQKGESETLAGFILELVKGFPKTGQKIKFENYTFAIENIEKRRIKQIKVTRN